MKTYDDCKKQVAETYQYEDWVTATAGRKPNGAAMDRLIREVCELYARHLANEAVKADRDMVANVITHYDQLGLLISDNLIPAIDSKPLPYPDEK